MKLIHIADPRNVIRAMKRITKEAKVTAIRFHDMRYIHASILKVEGVDVVKIAARIGHTNPKITLEFYAHLIPNSHSDVADILHNAIRNHTNGPQ